MKYSVVINKYYGLHTFKYNDNKISMGRDGGERR